MDVTDLTGRVIGYLTLAYNTKRQLEEDLDLTEAMEAEYRASVDALMKGLSTEYDLNFEIPEVYRSQVWKVLQESLPKQVSSDFESLLNSFAIVFVKFCYAIEAEYPDIDVPGLLQEIGLGSAN